MDGKRKMGFILIIIGILLILSQMQLIDFSSLISIYWPSLIILYGIYNCIQNRKISATSLSFITVGLILQIWELDLLPGELRQYIWPTILIVIGISMIFSQSNYSKKNNFKTDKFIDYFTILSGIETINATDDFKGGSITAILGGGEIDLSQAKMQQPAAQISITTIMGGVDLKVPRDWKVVATGIPILGGWDNKTVIYPDQTKILYVKCTAIMGGIEIKN